jgi:hypothetical protein
MVLLPAASFLCVVVGHKEYGVWAFKAVSSCERRFVDACRRGRTENAGTVGRTVASPVTCVTKPGHEEQSIYMALLRPCTTSAGFMATPEQPRRVRMADLKGAVESAGYHVVIDAKILMVIRKDVESSVYDTGKVILKTTDKDAAQTAYEELRPLLESAWS